MLSQKDADACLQAAAARLKKLSYEELEEFARAQGMLDDWRSQQVLVEGEKVDVNTMICKLGHLHKRISVELTLGAEPGVLREDAPFLYFERYKSGRFYPSPREEAREVALIKALPYAFAGAVVVVLMGLVWYLFLGRG